MTVPPLLVLGNVNVDLVMGEVDGWPAVGTEIMVPRSEMRPGGSAGNAALALTGFGVPHRLVASVGNDVMGGWLAESFDSRYSTWLSQDCATTITVGIVHKGGDRAFFTTPGHLLETGVDELLGHIPTAPTAASFAIVSGAFLMPLFMAGKTRLLRALREKGWRTAMDPGWPPQGWTAETRSLCREWLALSDYALFNLEEVQGLSGISGPDAATAELAQSLGAEQVLVVKRGPEGAAATRAGKNYTARAPAVKVIDTVGAGDTFNAAFLAHLSQEGGLQGALECGVHAASLAVSTYPRSYAL